MPRPMPGPLDGLTVLDLTRLLPGGYCTMLLADMGADVLKIEEPVRGDYMRWNPPLYETQSAYFVALCRNKRSMKLNLKDTRGRDILQRLVEDADVLIESFRPGVMARLGLGYDDLQAVNPRLIYCSMTGFGQDGPRRDEVGHDLNYVGIGGMLGLGGPCDGAPQLPSVQVADLAGGALNAAVGILAALRHRDRTGAGQYIDIAMLDGVVSWLSIHAAKAFATGEAPVRGGERLTGGWPCYQIYECADGAYVTLGALEPKFWANFCTAVGRPEWESRQLDTAPEGLVTEVRALFRTKPAHAWLEQLAPYDICFGPVHDIAGVCADPQVRARGMVFEAESPTEGRVTQLGVPIKFSETPCDAWRYPPPGFGEHTAAVLHDLGYDAAAIAALAEARVTDAPAAAGSPA